MKGYAYVQRGIDSMGIETMAVYARWPKDHARVHVPTGASISDLEIECVHGPYGTFPADFRFRFFP